ncbi:MAG TPA: hypothetical protein VE244_13855 [Nitrososphaeraceae archaeon]|nr:hypothetical protein [Nitrososphaeraceae archaeon]
MLSSVDLIRKNPNAYLIPSMDIQHHNAFANRMPSSSKNIIICWKRTSYKEEVIYKGIKYGSEYGYYLILQ